jgi:hypothetical protein
MVNNAREWNVSCDNGSTNHFVVTPTGISTPGSLSVTGNIFNTGQLNTTLCSVSTTTPIYRAIDTAGATDKKNWDYYATGGNYYFRANNDANNAFVYFLTFKRGSSGNSLGSLEVGSQCVAPLQTLTDGTTISTWDCALGQKAKVTLGAAGRTMPAVSNAVEGTTYYLWVIQDGTGSRTITSWGSGSGGFDFGTTGTPTLTTTASKADLLCFEAISIGGTLKLRYMGIAQGFS